VGVNEVVAVARACVASVHPARIVNAALPAVVHPALSSA